MFEKVKELMRKVIKKKAVKPARAYIKAPDRPRKEIIEAVTSHVEQEDAAAEVSYFRKDCTQQEVFSLCIQLINNIISMIEEHERTFKHIENHPTLPEDTKSDMQHLLNKFLVTDMSALSPAFPFLVGYSRKKDFEAIFKKALKKGAPGVLEYKKHI